MCRIVIVYQNHKRSRPYLQNMQTLFSTYSHIYLQTHIQTLYFTFFLVLINSRGQTTSHICVHQTFNCHVLSSMVSVNHKAIISFNNPFFLFYFHILALHYILALLLYKFAITVFLVFAFLTFRMLQDDATVCSVRHMTPIIQQNTKVWIKYLAEKIYISRKKQEKTIVPYTRASTTNKYWFFTGSVWRVRYQ